MNRIVIDKRGKKILKKGKTLKPHIGTAGYLVVNIYDKNGVMKQTKVHRLVAITFLENPNYLPSINHKSECKTDNQISNLEWCDVVYNNNYGTRNARVKERLINGKKSKPILQYDMEGKFIKEWESSMEIRRQTNFKREGICQCCRGLVKQQYGFVWRYKNEEH